ncbi:hypothetical protein ACFVW5_30070 [Streptomyces sp. NPDC058232]|uniref:hypothetical protein n=1 Tax=Streptomyces sp. NPDC058232 TaxID=3346393 RepID=UPI0036E64FA7
MSKVDQLANRWKLGARVAARGRSTRPTTARATQSNAASIASRGTGRCTRYDKLAVRYEATVLVAGINEWL